ncbi:DUF6655 family protein [Planctomycetota bacterium]
MRSTRIAALAAAILTLAIVNGCVGEIRETTTPRTSTEQLLLTTAAERAIGKFEDAEKLLRGKSVAIDDSRFEALEKGYVVSALRHYVSERGALLVPYPGGDGKAAPDLVLEIRSGALGINDTSWGIGIPALPLPVPQTTLTTTSPPAYLFFRGKQEGWAKLQLWLYNPVTHGLVARSGDLWGHSYYSTWWILFLGPFDFSNDIYPEDSQTKTFGRREK